MHSKLRSRQCPHLPQAETDLPALKSFSDTWLLSSTSGLEEYQMSRYTETTLGEAARISRRVAPGVTSGSGSRKGRRLKPQGESTWRDNMELNLDTRLPSCFLSRLRAAFCSFCSGSNLVAFPSTEAGTGARVTVTILAPGRGPRLSPVTCEPPASAASFLGSSGYFPPNAEAASLPPRVLSLGTPGAPSSEK